MEGKHVQLIFISVSGSFRENTDGNSGFYFVYCGQDRFESLFDVFPVKEETVEITHPCGKKRNFLHLFFGNVACTDRTAGVSKKYVEVASVVADIKYRCVLWHIFFSDHSNLKITVIGEENVPKDTPVLYIGNHRSYFDILLTYSRCPIRTGYIAKKEMEKIPLLSTWMRYLHCLFLDRKDIKQGLKTILTAVDKVKSGISICIFPEGTRNRNKDELDMLPFHEGSFKIATKANCPIIPIAISNSANIFEAHFPKISPAKVVVEYGKPIYPDELSKEDKRHVGEYTQNVIREMLIKNKPLTEK